MAALDQVSIDTSSLVYGGEHDGIRVWWTPAGDAVTLHHFPIPPDIPADPSDLAALRTCARSNCHAHGAVLVSLDTTPVDGCTAVRQIVKIAQQPSGMTYVGSLTLPFRDFSFVLKVQAEEHGLTGVRETAVLPEHLQAGTIDLDPEAEVIRGWTRDPYDPALHDGPYPNLSEAETYDARFPEHPLSRVRPLLRALSEGVHVSDFVRNSPPYVYPPAKRHRPWWRLW